MNVQNLLKTRWVPALALAVLYLIWKAVAQHFGVGDAAGDLVTDAVGLGNGGLALVWALGHCDGVDGPVVTLAKKALEADNVKLVLPWVRAEDEGEIRKVFDQAQAVRKLGGEARELADTHFFETLVRIHRAGEGAPFDGLKPAGRDLGPAVPAADQALESGSIEALEKLLSGKLHESVHSYFHSATSRREFDAADVKAGRAYVESYVPYIHFVERLWDAMQSAGHQHDRTQAGHIH